MLNLHPVRKKPPRFRAFSLTGQTLLAALFVLAAWLGGLYAFTRPLDTPPAPPLIEADAIVVLTGGSNRLQKGFELLDRGFGKQLFVSGVYQGVEVRELIDLMHEEKLTLHTDDDKERMAQKVVLGFEASNTIGNAEETANWMRGQGYRTFYLVTANYHMRRALLEFRQKAPDLTPLAYPVIPEGLDMANWWRNKTHRVLIIREYMKFLFVHARSWVDAFLKV